MPAFSGVVGGLVSAVALRLELEGAVLDVEVAAEAFGEGVEHLTGPAVADAGVVDDDVGGEHGDPAGDRPGVQVVHVDHAGVS